MVKKKVPVKKHFRKIKTSTGRKIVKVSKHMRMPGYVVRKQYKKTKKDEDLKGSEKFLSEFNKNYTEAELDEKYFVDPFSIGDYNREKRKSDDDPVSLIKSISVDDVGVGFINIDGEWIKTDNPYAKSRMARKKEEGLPVDFMPADAGKSPYRKGYVPDADYVEAMQKHGVYLPYELHEPHEKLYNELRNQGWDERNAVRGAYDKLQEDRSEGVQKGKMDSLLAAQQNVSDRIELKKGAGEKKLGMLREELGGVDKFFNAQGELKSEYSEDNDKKKELARATEERIRFAASRMKPPKAKLTVDEERRYLDELFNPRNEFQISRGEFTVELMKKPSLRKKIIEGEVPKEVEKQLKDLNLFTDDKGDIRLGKLQNFAKQADKHEKVMAGGEIPGTLKGHLRKINVHEPDEELLQSALRSNPDAKPIDVFKAMFSDANTGKSVKDYIKGAERLAENHPVPSVRLKARELVKGLKSQYEDLRIHKDNYEVADAIKNKIISDYSDRDLKGARAGVAAQNFAWFRKLPSTVTESPELIKEWNKRAEQNELLKKVDKKDPDLFWDVEKPKKTKADKKTEVQLSKSRDRMRKTQTELKNIREKIAETKKRLDDQTKLLDRSAGTGKGDDL